MERLISLAPPRLDTCNRDILRDYFENSWQLEELLLRSLVRPKTFYDNPDPLRNPLIFYLGHSAVFYVNKLIRVGLLEHRINPTYEMLFEIGVDPETPEQLQAAIAPIQWPEVEAVWEYRDRVYECIWHLLDNVPLTLPITSTSPLWALLMAIEHSRIHFETSSMLLRQVPVEALQCPDCWHYAPSSGNSPENDLVSMSGGTVYLGKPMDAPTYGWDIEYGHRQVSVEPFQASQYLVTNGEFLAFVQAQGYENPDYWDSEGWTWRTQAQAKQPKFWLSSKNTSDSAPSYRYRALFDEIPLPLDWPVEVNCHEAIAFCRWRGQGSRLMSEAEWKWACLQTQEYPEAKGQGSSNPNTVPDHRYNLNLKFGSPSPVGSQENVGSDGPVHGLQDLRGNVWEWLGDRITPLSGFQPHDLYEEYSAPFFDPYHNVMLGGAWASTGTYAGPDCRNWFRRNFHQHAGFRVAISA